MIIIFSLILLGVIMMFVEMLLTPGFGVAGVLGLGSLAGACWYAFTYCGESTGWWVLGIVLLLMIALLIWMLRSKTWKKAELDSVLDSRVENEIETVKPGERGTAVTRLAPLGTARFAEGEREVRSENGALIDAGTAVEVTRITDKKLFVKPINE